MSFPDGRLRRIAIPATAGNVAYNASPGAGKRWHVLGLKLILVCDITVANRTQRVILRDGAGAAIGVNHIASVGVASSTTTFALMGTIDNSAGTFGFNSCQGLGPPDNLLENTEYLGMTVDAGVAGDSYSGYLHVLEMPA